MRYNPSPLTKTRSQLIIGRQKELFEANSKTKMEAEAYYKDPVTRLRERVIAARDRDIIAREQMLEKRGSSQVMTLELLKKQRMEEQGKSTMKKFAN